MNSRLSVLFVLIAPLCFASSALAQTDDCAGAPVVATQQANFPFNIFIDWSTATPSVGLACGMGTGFPVPAQNEIDDMWFAVTAPSNGNLVVDHSYNPAGHAVYAQLTPGTCPTPGDIVYCDSNNQNGSTTPAQAGVTYLIRIGDNTAPNPPGPISVFVDFVPTVSNDNCATPEIVPSIPSTVPFDLFGSTPTVPALSSAPCITTGGITVRDSWYEVTPATSGMLGIETTDGVLVMVYNSPGVGVCPSPSDLVDIPDFIPGSGVDVDNGCNIGLTFKLPVLAGNTYLIRVGTTGNGVAGDMTFRIAQPPVNDNCDSPSPLGIGVTIPIDTLGATNLANSTHQTQFLDDVWYEIVAPGDGRLHIQAPNCTGQAFLSPGPGICPDDFDLVEPPVQNNPPAPPVAGAFVDANQCLFPQVCYGGRYVTVSAGDTILLRLGGGRFAGGATISTLTVDFYTHPANDECATAEAFSLASPFVTLLNTRGAIPPACSQPAHFTPGCAENCGQTVNADVWYRFTPPVSGLLTIDMGQAAYGILYNTDLSNGCPTTADGKICLGIGTFLEAQVVGGIEYYLRFFGQNSAPGLDTSMTVALQGFSNNDDCSNPDPVTLPTAVPVAWDNTAATDDINGLGCTGVKDLWYSFVAPTSGQCEVTVDDEGVVYSAYHAPGGLCPANQDELACESCFSQFGAVCTPWTFDFAVVAGETYMIRVSGTGQNPQTGTFELDYTNGPPVDVTCDSSVPGQVTASYTIPPGSSYDLGVDVLVNGSIVANIPETQLSYVQTLPGGFVGTIEIGFAGVNSTTGTTSVASCGAAFGGPANDDCANATPVGIGPAVFDNTISTVDPTAPLSSCSQLGSIGNDLWFVFNAPTSELYTASICTVPWNAIVEIWDGASGCPVPGDIALDCGSQPGCDASFTAIGGNNYYIRVLGAVSGFGPGILDIVPDCGALTGLTAEYDCVTGNVELNWDGGAHISYDVISDNQGPVVVGQVDNFFNFTNEAPGLRTYEVVGHCSNGAFLSSTVTVYVADVVTPQPDLILALESVENGGLTGFTDGAAAIEDALTQVGRPSTILSIEDFDTFPCLQSLLDAAENVWVVLGTFPFDYSLSFEENNVLAAFAASGKAVYLEGANHWAGFHFIGDLDDRDGVEPNIFGNIDEGDDSFTRMNGANSGLTDGDFSSYFQIGYNQDGINNESTDQLILTGTNDPLTHPPDPNITAGVIWRNDNDGAPGSETDYITGILAKHDLDGGVMISSSWEFGGFQGDKIALIVDYLNVMQGSTNLPMFRRGDTNADNGLNIADAIYLLGALFPTGTPNPLDCLDAADANNDGGINIADAIAILGSLFGTPATPLPGPNPNCGTENDAPAQTGIGCLVDTCP